MNLSLLADVASSGGVKFISADSFGSFLKDISSVFGSFISIMGSFFDFVFSNPLLIALILLPLIGVGLGFLFKLLRGV